MVSERSQPKELSVTEQRFVGSYKPYFFREGEAQIRGDVLSAELETGDYILIPAQHSPDFALAPTLEQVTLAELSMPAVKGSNSYQIRIARSANPDFRLTLAERKAAEAGIAVSSLFLVTMEPETNKISGLGFIPPHNFDEPRFVSIGSESNIEWLSYPQLKSLGAMMPLTLGQRLDLFVHQGNIGLSTLPASGNMHGDKVLVRTRATGEHKQVIDA